MRRRLLADERDCVIRLGRREELDRELAFSANITAGPAADRNDLRPAQRAVCKLDESDGE